MKKIHKLLSLFIFIFTLFLLVGCAELFRFDYGSDEETPTSNSSTINSSETKKSSVSDKTSPKTSTTSPKTSTKTSSKTTTATPTSVKTTTNKPTTSNVTPTTTGTPTPTSTNGGGTPTSTTSGGQGATPTSTTSGGQGATPTSTTSGGQGATPTSTTSGGQGATPTSTTSGGQGVTPTSTTSGGQGVTPTSTTSSGQGVTPTSSSSSGSSQTGYMEDTYRYGRDEILKLTGIALPALEDIELKNESYFNDNNALFVIDGNSEIFESFVNAAKAVLTTTPIIDTNSNVHWDLSELVGGKHYLGFLDISFVNGEIRFEYDINEAYVVTIEALTGGNAILKDDGVEVTLNQGVYLEDYDKLSVEATPDSGYRFIGWYNGTTLLETDNPYNYTVSNEDITITAKFELIPTMTESYSNGRNQVHEITGIWLPETVDIELKSESYFNDNNALFVIDGNSEIFESFVNAAKAVLTGTPTIDTNTNVHWDLSELVGNKNYLGFLDISFVNGEIRFEYDINEAYEVTVEASSGGSAILKDDQVAVTGNQGIYQEDYDKLSLEATPNAGYRFIGWYNGTTLLETSNPYNYTVGTKDITITAKFELIPTMTESYSDGRNEFHEITGIWLPEITGVELLNSSSFDTDKHKADFDIPYTSDALTNIIETVTNELEENIDFSDDKNYENVKTDSAYFEYFVSSEVRDYEAYVSIFVENPTSNNPVLRTQYWIRYYYTIELVSDTGGSAIMKHNNEVIEGNKIALHESESLSFIATPDTNYTIQGFYEGNTNLQLNNSSPYYVSTRDVTITAKFKSSTNAVTQSYKEAQDLILAQLGLHLEDAYDVETVNTDKTNTSDNYFSIIIYNATLDLFNTIFPSFKAEIEAKVKDKNDVITYYGDDFYHNDDDYYHWWSFKVNDSDTAGDCQISFEYTNVKSRLSIVVTKPMTIDYMVARKRLYQVADILLPVYKGIEISDPYYDWSVERGFFSQGFKNTSTSYYNQVKALFDEKFPTSDITYITENVSCTWNTYRIVDNLGYFVYPHIIYSDYQGKNETSVYYSANPDYYSSGVVFFKELTGAELPIISGLECQYKITANSVTFEVFKDEGNLESSVSTSYKSVLASMNGYTESVPTSSDGYTIYTYTNGSKIIKLKYKAARVVVESNFVNVVGLYSKERKLVGDFLPDKANITVTEFAYKQQPSYGAGAKIIMTGENLTYADYLAIENYYASSYNKDGEATGNEASGRTAKFKYAVTKYKVVWIPTTSTTSPIIKVIWDYHETNVENL